MPSKRTTAAKKAAELSTEDQAKRDLLVKDLEVQTEKLISDKHKQREIEGVASSITTMFKVCGT